MADLICERAWKGQGVRVFCWPCGTLAVVPIGARGDVVLLRECEPQLLVTYARAGVCRSNRPGDGPMLKDILHDLNWARAVAA